ncbi:excisionase family protein [Hahella sp. HN01]|uniref:excisionase family protein n=1 Tax=Hahella sp. HN01 TaxID=2847262 RepID=UPI001C1EC926|nr:excisionase family protein [Hahella sp. HN01]MBU6952922.1 excisionase family protein [Hahella sp. HN01]
MNDLKNISVTPAKWVAPKLLIAIFGITVGAAKKYRERGNWCEGIHYKRHPGNCRGWVYNREEIEKWLGEAAA